MNEYVTLIFTLIASLFSLTNTVFFDGYQSGSANDYQLNDSGFLNKDSQKCEEGAILCNGECWDDCKEGYFSCEKKGGICRHNESTCKERWCNDECWEYCDENETFYCTNDGGVCFDEFSFIFIDNSSGCPVSGELSLNDIFIGNFENGKILFDYDKFLLLRTAFNDSNESNLNLLKIRGRTDDCFNLDERGFLYVEYFEMEDFYYFTYGDDIYFDFNIEVRSPYYYEAMQDFVRLNETKEYVESLNFDTESNEEKIEKIMKIGVAYSQDILKHGVGEYWQTPSETLSKKYGDCEDWAFTVISAIRQYNDSIDCHAAVFDTHVSIFCFIDDEFLIFDRGRTKMYSAYKQDLSETDNKKRIRSLVNDYFRYWGISPSNRHISVLLNEKENIAFSSNEEFISWAYEILKENNP